MFPQDGTYADSCSVSTTSILFIHLQPVNSFMVVSVPDRTGYMELCSVCVLTEGTLVHGRIRERSTDVLIGRLFIETVLVMVKQNSDLLCHSQLDGSQGCVAMSC